MGRKNLEQTPCGIYNAYKEGLFGHHHSPQVLSSIGLDRQSYQMTIDQFVALCNRLGGRVLNLIQPGCTLVTPESISPDLAAYMGRVFNVDPSRVTFINAEGLPGSDLPTRILNDPRSMDRLRRWAADSPNPVVYPRTLTAETAAIAREIGAAHIHQIPPGLERPVRGIHPSFDYLERHTAQQLNSKVANYLILKEIDRNLGTAMAPVGDVAFDLDKAAAIVQTLWRSGGNAIIKADLSVDGMGNVRFPKPNQDLDNEALKLQIRQELQQRGIPLGPGAGVVVTELLDLIYDPSVEWFSPPHEWGIPLPYYWCGMLMSNGGFAGTIIDDPVLSYDSRRPNIPSELLRRNVEYRTLIRQATDVGTEFMRRFWQDGYVGIADSDFGISLAANGRLRINILEFNLIRETGGTAAYRIKRRLDALTGTNGTTIARDSVTSKIFARPLRKVIDHLADEGLEFTSNRARGSTEGVIVLGQVIKEGRGTIMTLTYGEDYAQAYRLDNELIRRTR